MSLAAYSVRMSRTARASPIQAPEFRYLNFSGRAGALVRAQVTFLAQLAGNLGVQGRASPVVRLQNQTHPTRLVLSGNELTSRVRTEAASCDTPHLNVSSSIRMKTVPCCDAPIFGKKHEKSTPMLRKTLTRSCARGSCKRPRIVPLHRARPVLPVRALARRAPRLRVVH